MILKIVFPDSQILTENGRGLNFISAVILARAGL